MFKAFSPAALKDLEDAGTIDLAIKSGWEMAGSWSAKPSYITYCIGPEREHIFTCYFHRDKDLIQITNVEATKRISPEKALIDAYLYVAIKGLVDFAVKLGAKRLVVDSYIPSVADHLLDLGFNITSKGLQSGARGCKLIED